MRLYLCQHGKATSKDEDPDRPLTDEGRGEVGRVARRLASAEVRLDGIWHSGKLRAKQTADILAEHLSPAGGLEARDDLSPMDDPTSARSAAEGSGADAVLLSGHLPHLSRLCSLMLTGDADREPVAFRNAGVVCLAWDGNEEGWKLEWALVPELAGG